MYKMKPFKIKRVKAREILDSKGTPTIEVDLVTETGSFQASVPSGVSTGKSEAVELRDGGMRYNGKGVLNAVRNINELIAPKFEGLMISNQEEIDYILIRLDGTKDKSRLGANAILAVSIAACRACVAQNRDELYRYFLDVLCESPGIPNPCFLLIEGGMHAGNYLDMQEFMVWPYGGPFSENLRVGVEVYNTLRGILEKRYSKNSVNVGLEGGFAPPLKKTEEALDLIVSALKKSGYEDKVLIAIDVAASTFFKNGSYRFEGKNRDVAGMLDFYEKILREYPIFSIEDPFAEEDFEGFKDMNEKFGMKVSVGPQSKEILRAGERGEEDFHKINSLDSYKGLRVVGDDLLTTNVERMKKAFSLNACNATVIKPNQVGTVTETIKAIIEAKDKNKWGVFIKHRSGETNDDFIADLAAGLGGHGWLMAGAPARGERLAKYNRLLRIEEELNNYYKK